MAEKQEGLPNYVEKDTKHHRPEVFKVKMNKLHIPWSKGSDKSLPATAPPLKIQAWDESTRVEMQRMDRKPSTPQAPSTREFTEHQVTVQKVKKGRKDSSSKTTQPFLPPPPPEPPFNVPDSVALQILISERDRLLEDKRTMESRIKEYEHQLAVKSVQESRSRNAGPIAVNSDIRIAELEKQLEAKDAEKEWLVMDSQKEKEQLELKYKKEIKLLRATFVDEKRNLEHDLKEMRKQLEKAKSKQSSLLSQANDGAGASSLSESDKQVAKLTDDLMDKEEELDKLTRRIEGYEEELKEYKTLYDAAKLAILTLKQEVKEGEEKYRHLVTQTNQDKKRMEEEMEKYKHHVTQANENKKGMEEEMENLRINYRSTNIKQIMAKKMEDEILEGYEKELKEYKTVHDAAKLAILKLKQEVKEGEEKYRHLVTQANQGMEEEMEKYKHKANQGKKKMEEDISEKKETIRLLTEKLVLLQQHLADKDQLSQESSHKLKTLQIEFQVAKDQNEHSREVLSSLNQQMADWKRISDTRGDRIRELTCEIEDKGKEMSALEEDLGITKQQIKIFNEELVKTLNEQKRAREIIAQLQSENKKVLTMTGKKSLDEMRKFYEEMREEKKTMDEEIATCQQQARAYKRQVDDLNEKLRVAREDKQTLQDRNNSLCYLEAEAFQLQSKLHDQECELKGEIEKMRAANKVLQQRLRTAWSDVESLQDEKQALTVELYQIRSQQPPRVEQDRPSWSLEENEVFLTDEKIGGGAYGSVWIAQFRGTRVAAKKIHDLILSEYNKDKFMKEMTMSASLHHPNIVQFIGATLAKDKCPILLYELMETSLYSFLQSPQPLTRPLIVSIGYDVALALTYLHLWKPHPIIHRDISSPNILMEALPSGRWRCKISDFGSAKLQPHAKTVGPGNSYYAAYEASDPNKHTTAMDIYSFGVLLAEITLKCPPEADGASRERQARNISWAPMRQLVLQCIVKDQTRRLGITGVTNDLCRLLQF